MFKCSLKCNHFKKLILHQEYFVKLNEFDEYLQIHGVIQLQVFDCFKKIKLCPTPKKGWQDESPQKWSLFNIIVHGGIIFRQWYSRFCFCVCVLGEDDNDGYYLLDYFIQGFVTPFPEQSA